MNELLTSEVLFRCEEIPHVENQSPPFQELQLKKICEVLGTPTKGITKLTKMNGRILYIYQNTKNFKK
jgi:hypothetical protein